MLLTIWYLSYIYLLMIYDGSNTSKTINATKGYLRKLLSASKKDFTDFGYKLP